MNTYIKYCPNVFVALAEEEFKKGDEITITTKYGKEHVCTVFNFLGNKDGKFLYSVVRNDGFNYQEYCKNKAERRKSWADSASNKAESAFEASKEGAEFLRLGEPIKIGHHSEKRHRALIERNHNRMRKGVALTDKANDHISKAEYWERKSQEINLSMPESVEYFEYKLGEAKKKHGGLKDGSIPRDHSFSLQYAKKDVNDLDKKYKLALKLWG